MNGFPSNLGWKDLGYVVETCSVHSIMVNQLSKRWFNYGQSTLKKVVQLWLIKPYSNTSLLRGPPKWGCLFSHPLSAEKRSQCGEMGGAVEKLVWGPWSHRNFAPTGCQRASPPTIISWSLVIPLFQENIGEHHVTTVSISEDISEGLSTKGRPSSLKTSWTFLSLCVCVSRFKSWECESYETSKFLLSWIWWELLFLFFQSCQRFVVGRPIETQCISCDVFSWAI